MEIQNKKWIINKRDDLVWLIFSGLSGFLIIGLYYLLHLGLFFSMENSVLIIYLFWAMLFDGTHAFATYTRTFFDKNYYKNNKALLLKSFWVFIAGPLFIVSVKFHKVVDGF